MARAAMSALFANSTGDPASNAASTVSLCTITTMPSLACAAFAAKAKNSFASASTLSGCSTSDIRVKLRSSAYMTAARRRSGLLLVMKDQGHALVALSLGADARDRQLADLGGVLHVRAAAGLQ